MYRVDEWQMVIHFAVSLVFLFSEANSFWFKSLSFFHTNKSLISWFLNSNCQRF